MDDQKLLDQILKLTVTDSLKRLIQKKIYSLVRHKTTITRISQDRTLKEFQINKKNNQKKSQRKFQVSFRDSPKELVNTGSPSPYIDKESPETIFIDKNVKFTDDIDDS